MNRFWKIYIHIIFGTKNRRHFLKGDIEKQVHCSLREAARAWDIIPVATNSAWNHCHTLLSWNPELSVDEVAAELKNRTALAVGMDPQELWQKGYAAFSVNPGRVEHLKGYISRQKDLHRNEDTIPQYESWLSLY